MSFDDTVEHILRWLELGSADYLGLRPHRLS